MKNASSHLVYQLNRSSAHYEDPFAKIPWGLLGTDDYWLPPEALSLAGLDEFSLIDEERKRALSRYEFLNFIEAGIWLEAVFMERMAAVLRARTADLSELKYRAHEIREESGHTLMFLELVERSGLTLSRKQWAPFLLTVFARKVPIESAEFWLATTLGEEVPDQMNRYIRQHSDGVNDAVVQMCVAHMKDEARHIAYARELVCDKAVGISGIRRAFATTLMNHLLRQFVDIFYYPSAEVYARAGLMPGTYWRRAASRNPHRRRFLKELIDPSLRLLRPHGFALTMR